MLVGELSVAMRRMAVIWAVPNVSSGDAKTKDSVMSSDNKVVLK